MINEHSALAVLHGHVFSAHYIGMSKRQGNCTSEASVILRIASAVTIYFYVSVLIIAVQIANSKLYVRVLEKGLIDGHIGKTWLEVTAGL